MLLVVLAMGTCVKWCQGWEYSSPDDCTDVCWGAFAFRTEAEAVECCKKTINYYENALPTPTEVPTDVRNATKGVLPHQCKNFGGPKDTNVRVRFPEPGGEINQASVERLHCIMYFCLLKISKRIFVRLVLNLFFYNSASRVIGHS